MIGYAKGWVEIPISQMVKADWNYKTDDDVKKEKLKGNIKRNGQLVNSVVRRLDTGFYEVIDGNHRYDAFIELGFDKIMCFNMDKISLAQAERIALEINETRFDTDKEKLAAIIQELKLEFPLDDLLETLPFTDLQFEEFDIEAGIDVDPEEIPEDSIEATPPIQPTTQPGDVYELVSIYGNMTTTHRLMNGDSTKDDDVAKLMNGSLAHMIHTDPPYNIAYPQLNIERNSSAKDWSAMYCSNWKDEMTDEDYCRFLADFLSLAKKYSIKAAHYYVWHATTYYRELLNAFDKSEITYDKVPIQWVKQCAPLAHVRYKRKSEPCIYAGFGAINGSGKGARWFGPNNEVNIWEISRDHNVNYIHPTQKPLALAARAIKNSSKAGEIVLDLFGGSGSTMIAADQMKRNAYLMEMGQEFCDLMVGRFAKYKSDFNQEFKVLRNGEDFTNDAIDLVQKLKIRTCEKTLGDE